MYLLVRVWSSKFIKINFTIIFTVIHSHGWFFGHQRVISVIRSRVLFFLKCPIMPTDAWGRFHKFSSQISSSQYLIITFLQNSILKKIVILFFVINFHVYFQGFSVVKNLQAQLWSFAKFQAIHPCKTSENKPFSPRATKKQNRVSKWSVKVCNMTNWFLKSRVKSLAYISFLCSKKFIFILNTSKSQNGNVEEQRNRTEGKMCVNFGARHIG